MLPLGFSSTQGTVAQLHQRSTRTVHWRVLLPAVTLAVSATDSCGSPQMCCAVRGPCPCMSWRTRLQLEQGVPAHTATTTLEVIQPWRTLSTCGCVQSPWAPNRMSKETVPHPCDSMAELSRPEPANNSRNTWNRLCFREICKALRSKRVSCRRTPTAKEAWHWCSSVEHL